MEKRVKIMKNGTVKWFNATKGYGFITVEGEKNDVFVHISAVQEAGISELKDGQKLTFEVASNRGKNSAVNIQVTE